MRGRGRLVEPRHCERSEAIENLAETGAGLLRRVAPRNDEKREHRADCIFRSGFNAGPYGRAVCWTSYTMGSITSNASCALATPTVAVWSVMIRGRRRDTTSTSGRNTLRYFARTSPLAFAMAYSATPAASSAIAAVDG